MKKRFLFMLLVFVALLTIAQECQTNNSNKPVVGEPYIGGDIGLQVAFSEGYPPKEIFDGGTDPFVIELNLKNLGETDIRKENVRIILSGLNPSDFGKVESDFIKNAIDKDIGKKYKDIDGSIVEYNTEANVRFPQMRFNPKLTGNFPLRMMADVCYTYQSRASTQGCIRSDLSNLALEQNPVCSVDEEKKVYNSGAPIHITRFEEKRAGTDTVFYLLTIKHVGQGYFYLPGTKCPSGLEGRDMENKLRFTIDSSVADLNCNFYEGTGKTGIVALRNGEATVRCEQQKKSQLDYQDLITVNLDYDYKEIKPLDITILRRGN